MDLLSQCPVVCVFQDIVNIYLYRRGLLGLLSSLQLSDN